MPKKAAQVVNCLKKKRTNLIFLSPHLDDAIFSCEGIIEQLRNSNDISILTVFTNGDKPPYTLSTRKYLRIMGYKDLTTIYESRRKEDEEICKKLGIRHVHLGYKDSLVRKYKHSQIKNALGRFIPEVNHLYPIFKKFMGKGIVNAKPNTQDEEIMAEIRAKFSELNSKNTIFFAPLAIGDHVDHHVVRLAVEKSNLKIIYYCDIPYMYANPLPRKLISNMKLRKFILDIDKKKKERISEMYISQYKHVFNKKKLGDQEIYYINKNAYEFLKYC